MDDLVGGTLSPQVSDARALAGDAHDWQMHVAEWLGVRRDTVRDWRSGRVEARPPGGAHLPALLEDPEEWVGGLQEAHRELVPRHPHHDHKHERHLSPHPP